jgi:RNA ligase
MPHIHDLIPPQVLADALEEKYVRVKVHPDGDKLIYNYAEKAAYERMWNEATRQCRGLITDAVGNILARPYPKFFNIGEHDGERLPYLDRESQVETTDKMDGSLGILYPHAGGWRVATRGSFISEQATWATRHYQRHFADWTPEPGLTYLVEIVYPENRIVLDYQGTQDLVLLGAVRIEDGSILGPLDVDWPGRSTRILYPRSLESAVAFPPRDNAEGVVVRYVEGPMKDKMFKVKQDSYVALHRIVTGLNKITVWEALVAGTYADLIEQVPDELFEWCDRVKGELERLYEDVRHTTAFYYDEVLAALSAEYTQKDFALQVQQVKSPAWMVGMGIDDRSFQGLIFAHHSGRDLNTARGYWKFIRPRGDTFAKQMSEDVA